MYMTSFNVNLLGLCHSFLIKSNQRKSFLTENIATLIHVLSVFLLRQWKENGTYDKHIAMSLSPPPLSGTSKNKQNNVFMKQIAESQPLTLGILG